MTMRRTRASLGVAMGFILAGGFAVAAINGPDSREISAPTGTPAIDIAPREAPRANRVEPSGNPLWAIPLSGLTATRERPIFLPSRRPPAPVVAGPPAVAPAAPPPPPAAPERPQLRLVGAVIGETEAIAVFLDPANNPVRLRTGQAHAGWLLQSVRGREAVLQKDRETAILALPSPDASPPSGPVLVGGAQTVGAAPAGPAVSPSASGAGYIPFIPRHTPKNGESDGL